MIEMFNLIFIIFLNKLDYIFKLNLGLNMFALYFQYYLFIIFFFNFYLLKICKFNMKTIQFGNFIFYLRMNKNSKFNDTFAILSLIGLFVGVINAALPMQKLNERFFKIKEDDKLDLNFEDAEIDFDTVLIF